jgi:hypothetical protein
VSEEKKLPKNQVKHKFLSEFEKRLKQKGLDHKLNRYTEQYAAQALIDSYTVDECYKLMNYYFEVSLTPSWLWFKNNADKIYKAKNLRDEDSRVRMILRQQAKDWLK